MTVLHGKTSEAIMHVQMRPKGLIVYTNYDSFQGEIISRNRLSHENKSETA